MCIDVNLLKIYCIYDDIIIIIITVFANYRALDGPATDDVQTPLNNSLSNDCGPSNSKQPV
jgi:hypothetical protein